MDVDQHTITKQSAVPVEPSQTQPKTDMASTAKTATMAALSQSSDDGDQLMHFFGHPSDLTQLSQPSPHGLATAAVPMTTPAVVSASSSGSASAPSESKTIAVTVVTEAHSKPVSPDTPAVVPHVTRNSGGSPAVSERAVQPTATAATGSVGSKAGSSVIPHPRWGHSATRIKGGQIVLFGGDGGTDQTLKEVLVYDPG